MLHTHAPRPLLTKKNEQRQTQVLRPRVRQDFIAAVTARATLPDNTAAVACARWAGAVPALNTHVQCHVCVVNGVSKALPDGVTCQTAIGLNEAAISCGVPWFGHTEDFGRVP